MEAHKWDKIVNNLYEKSRVTISVLLAGGGGGGDPMFISGVQMIIICDGNESHWKEECD